MKPFRVGLCQLEAHDLEDAETALQEILRALDEAGEAGAQLVGIPECSYPAYYLRDSDPYARPGVRPFAEVSALLAEKARQHGYWLAAGIARPFGDGKLANSALIFDPNGECRGHYDKSFLWHFDSNWFERGTSFPVWETEFANFGVLICADGRQPEVARSLVLNGAEVILDLTAWVSSGADPAALSNPQCEYMMPARAFENGVWVAAADKWGTEAGSIVYAGRSTVIDPLGRVRVCAPSQESLVLTYDLEPIEAPLVPRRPSLPMYRRLVEPLAPGAFEEHLELRTLDPGQPSARVAVVPSAGSFDAAAMVNRFRDLRAQQADLVVFGGDDGPEGWQVELLTLERAVSELGGAIVLGVTTTGCSVHQSVVLLTAAGCTYEHVATHGRGIQLGETGSPVIPTPVGWIGMMCGDEGLVPEVARHMLNDADLIAWPVFGTHPMLDVIARTRADENRLFVAAAWQGGGVVSAPTGAPLAVSPRGSGIAMTATVHPALAHYKEMAPGTHVVDGRVPEAYGALVR